MKSYKGQSVIEILIALSILMFSITAIIFLSFTNQSASVDSQNNNEAINIADEALEDLRASAKENFEGVVGATSIDGIYTKDIIVVDIDQYTKEVTSRVSWGIDPGRTQKIELITIISDPSSIPDLGGDPGCGGIVGDWTNPQSLGGINLSTGNQATDLDVIDKIVYLTAEASSASKNDFFIIDAQNGSSPVIVGTLHTGPGLNSVDATNEYAYVANSGSSQEFQVIDVTDMNTPTLVAGYNISGSAEANSIFYLDEKVYVGTDKNDISGEFHVFDVSNPLSPTLLGSFEVNDNINDIHVGNGKAYLGTNLDNAGLMVLDISDPGNITNLGQAFSSDTASVYTLNSSISQIGPGQEFTLVNTSDPSNISLYGSVSAGDTINDIVSGNYLAFLATSKSNRELQIINITDPSSPTLHSFLDFPQVASGIDCEENFVYVSARSNDGLRIVTSGP